MTKAICVALLKNTFQREIRNKTLIILFVLSLMILFGINALFTLFDSGPLGSFKLLAFYSVTTYWCGLIGALLGVNCIKSDTQYGITHQILAFPIHPMVYILTRIVGTWLTAVCYYVAILLIAFISFSLISKSLILPSTIIGAFVVPSVTMLIIITLGAFVSILFSKLQSFEALIFLWSLISLSNSSVSKMLSFEISGMFSGLNFLINWLFPHIGSLHQLSSELLQGEVKHYNVWIEIPHTFASYLLLVWAIYFLFKKNDFQ